MKYIVGEVNVTFGNPACGRHAKSLTATFHLLCLKPPVFPDNPLDLREKGHRRRESRVLAGSRRQSSFCHGRENDFGRTSRCIVKTVLLGRGNEESRPFLRSTRSAPASLRMFYA